jgi:mannose-1-phosphate guanylyltransferase/phosphomannomutase
MIDASGERLYMVDNKNNIYDSHEELFLLTKLYLETHKVNQVAFPIGATMAVSMLAREKGVREVRTESTHLAMMQAALTNGIDFVGGTRGGFIFPEFGFGCDAMYALMKTLEMLAKLDINLSDLEPHIPRFTRLHKDVECPWHKKGQVMRNLIESTKDMPRDVIDGVRVITQDAWCLITPDPEEPIFSLTVEARTETRAEDFLSEYEDLVRKWQE